MIELRVYSATSAGGFVLEGDDAAALHNHIRTLANEIESPDSEEFEPAEV